MKTKKYYRVLNLGLFPYDILVCQGMSTADVKAFLKKQFKIIPEGPDVEAAFEHTDTQHGKTIQLAGHQTVLWLKYPPTTPSAIATLAHEALHAVNFIFATMGVPQTHENDEVYAYTLEYVVGEVLKDFK